MGSCLSRGAVTSNKVQPEFDEEKDYLGQNGYSKAIKNKDGVELFAYFWPADPNVPLKGIIQLAHGNATYTCFDYLKFKGPGQPNVYEGSWVAAFNHAGFAVCGIDHQGFGRSKGVRALGGRFQVHVDNLLQLSDYVVEEGGAHFPKGLPYFLVGHSMGGLAATVACVQQPTRYSGLVLLSPLLSLDHTKANGSMRPLMKVTPKSEDGSTTSDRPVPWIYEAWAADPYVHDGGLRTRNVEEFMSATEQLGAAGGMEALSLPLLVFQSERDTNVEPEGAKKLHERAGSTDKTLRLLIQQWHVLTKEEGWEALLEETSAWLASRATNNGGLTRDPLAGPSPGAKEAAPARGSAPGVAGAEGEGAKANAGEASPPLLTRSMSMLERMPEHEPLLARSQDQGGLQMRRYSFSGRMPRAGTGIDGMPTASAASLLGPLPPLGQRRSLGTLPPELAAYNLRGRLPPLPPLMPLLDRTPLK